MTHLFVSQKFRRVAIQLLFVAIVVAIIISIIVVGHDNITSQGIATGFGFLETTTGWPVSFSIIDVGPRSTYARVLIAGILNTLLVGFLTLIFATLLGLFIAFMRISKNTMANIVGGTYIEVFRNVPVILQVFFWYAILTHLPGVRDAYDLGGLVYFSNRGLIFPVPELSFADFGFLVLWAIVITIGLFVTRNNTKLKWRYTTAGLAFVALFVLLLLTGREAGAPLISIPEQKGLRFVGGLALKPEFSALLVGLVLFGAAYIGEIIRGGLLSVNKGKLEAGVALGLSPFQVNRYIRIPLAFRAMLPSLTNQFIWLMKGTTVGIAIGFPDYFAIISTSINQTGQTLELLGLLMLGFIIINYSLGFIMNQLNDHFKLKGRS